MWEEWYVFEQPLDDEASEEDTPFLDFDFFSLLSNPKDYYKILELNSDASDEAIRSNYIRLALKWHPDKKKGESAATSKFSEAYQVLSDPAKRHKYDKLGVLYAYDPDIVDYLIRHKGLILTCNGLGMKCSMW